MHSYLIIEHTLDLGRGTIQKKNEEVDPLVEGRLVKNRAGPARPGLERYSVGLFLPDT